MLHAPTDIKDTFDISKVQPAPSKKLKLDWVYGYRGKDCRSNLYQLPTGEIVYFVAAVVVLHNADEQSQRHYIGHTNDVKSLTVHPNKLLVATGQCAGHDRNDTMVRRPTHYFRFFSQFNIFFVFLICFHNLAAYKSLEFCIIGNRCNYW